MVFLLPKIVSDLSNPVFKYMSLTLAEDNVEEITWEFPDDFTLHNTEKLLYDPLSEKYPDFSNQTRYLDADFSGSSSARDTVGATATGENSGYSSMDSRWGSSMILEEFILFTTKFPYRI